MSKFDGKVALVSAASSGIGKAIAKVMAGDGCKVHIFSKSQERISAAAEELHKVTGSEINYSAGDMTNLSNMNRVIAEVKKRSGKVDFLIINYGDPKIAPFLELTEEDWDSAINMFIKSSVKMIKAFLPSMLNNKGRIIFVTSMTTKQPMDNFALSASLRSAIVSLSKVISLEYSSNGITSNSISQGFFATPRLENVAKGNAMRDGNTVEESYERMKNSIPARRFGKPEEIGYLVSFLCSEEGSYINGANIQIDGGIVKFPF